MIDIGHDEVHVIWRSDINMWCARSIIGDYGISKDKMWAYASAKYAFLSCPLKYKKLVVHDKDGNIEMVITNIKGETPSSQFFQDDVP